jgi:hypothetical protein
MVPPSEGSSAERTSVQLLSVPVGEEVPWPSDVPHLDDVDNGQLIFDTDVPAEPCSCVRVCGKECSNLKDAYLCTPETCGAPSSTHGRRLHDARDLKLMRTSTGIGVFLGRMLCEDRVIGPYVGKLTTVGPRDTKYYTAVLKNVSRRKNRLFYPRTLPAG